MGYANCGENSAGRPIGYAIEATCDHPECAVVIDRGLGFACGYYHGATEHSCDRYFCSDHLELIDHEARQLCPECYARYQRDNKDGKE